MGHSRRLRTAGEILADVDRRGAEVRLAQLAGVADPREHCGGIIKKDVGHDAALSRRRDAERRWRSQRPGPKGKRTRVRKRGHRSTSRRTVGRDGVRSSGNLYGVSLPERTGLKRDPTDARVPEWAIARTEALKRGRPRWVVGICVVAALVVAGGVWFWRATYWRPLAFDRFMVATSPSGSFTADDGRWVLVPGGCKLTYRTRVRESPTEVQIRVETHGEPPGECFETLTVELASPLGERIVIDDVSGRAARRVNSLP